jgi:hypothetical protein
MSVSNTGVALAVTGVNMLHACGSTIQSSRIGNAHADTWFTQSGAEPALPFGDRINPS